MEHLPQTGRNLCPRRTSTRLDLQRAFGKSHFGMGWCARGELFLPSPARPELAPENFSKTHTIFKIF